MKREIDIFDEYCDDKQIPRRHRDYWAWKIRLTFDYKVFFLGVRIKEFKQELYNCFPKWVKGLLDK